MARVPGHLRRDGLLVDDGMELECSESEVDGDQLVLSGLGTGARFRTDLAGPERRPGRIPYAYEARTQPRLQALCAAQVCCMQVPRPPISAEQIERFDGGRLGLKRASGDGTWVLDMDKPSVRTACRAGVAPVATRSQVFERARAGQ